MTPAERAAVEAETIAKVVEWLRREAETLSDLWFAKAIERGEWKR